MGTSDKYNSQPARPNVITACGPSKAMTTPNPMRRHFVATAFVVHDDAVLLHWHRKVKGWLPPGGHVEPNEDPVQAVLREVLEETGLDVDIVPTVSLFQVEDLEQVQPPVTILIEDIPDDGEGPHKHIDFIYFTVPKEAPNSAPPGWKWFTRKQLEERASATNEEGVSEPPPEDVIVLGIAAIDAARRMAADGR